MQVLQYSIDEQEFCTYGHVGGPSYDKIKKRYTAKNKTPLLQQTLEGSFANTKANIQEMNLDICKMLAMTGTPF